MWLSLWSVLGVALGESLLRHAKGPIELSKKNVVRVKLFGKIKSPKLLPQSHPMVSHCTTKAFKL